MNKYTLTIFLLVLCSNVHNAQSDDTELYHQVANEFLKSIDKKTYSFYQFGCCGFYPGEGTNYFLKENSIFNENGNDILKLILQNNYRQKRKNIKINFSKIDNENIKPHSKEFFQSLKLLARKARGEDIGEINTANEWPELVFSIYLNASKNYALVHYSIYEKELPTDYVFDKVYILFERNKNTWKKIKQYKIDR
ncbi:hypothetical protein [Croceitalea sp. P059]|uniref:hypothetical protein n=1 Tax=Croceitalea sp. P059 TaxID=3075601 RepID=UPI002888DAC3|nr:hypothetical protein [Croceitalea sp. P059]MDT0539076.1 hypothetical protein [Croceitalea sp. P059]